MNCRSWVETNQLTSTLNPKEGSLVCPSKLHMHAEPVDPKTQSQDEHSEFFSPVVRTTTDGRVEVDCKRSKIDFCEKFRPAYLNTSPATMGVAPVHSEVRGIDAVSKRLDAHVQTELNEIAIVSRSADRLRNLTSKPTENNSNASKPRTNIGNFYRF